MEAEFIYKFWEDVCSNFFLLSHHAIQIAFHYSTSKYTATLHISGNTVEKQNDIIRLYITES